MHRLLTRLIVNTILQRKHAAAAQKSFDDFSNYRLAKGLRELQIVARQYTTSVFLVGCGILSAGFGLKGFLLPNHFIDGGATGIALLTAGLTGWPLPVLLVLINIPFILLGYRVIGRGFALKTALAIGGLALCTAFFPYPIITEDKLLVAVFGGFFLGAGIGLSVRGGAVIDGTEVLAIYFSRQRGLTMGDVILIFNIIIFSAAAWLLTLETALYSILTYLAASKAVDFIIEGIEEYTGVTIISIKPDEVREMIVNTLRRGVTVYVGKAGYGRSGCRDWEQDILFTVITRLELSKLKAELEKIDPNAFTVMHSINDSKGGLLKKRPLH
ncbi:MAG: YitT family protein [Saprospiraceae bacterium]